MAGTINLPQYADGSGGGDSEQVNVALGAGFGTKTASSPAIWDDFRLGSNGQLLSDYSAAWVPYAGSGAAVSTLNPRYADHKSAYNNFDRGQFWTNYKQYSPSRSVYLSYYARTSDFRGGGVDGGIVKWGRVTSSAAAGGGGVYNGEGVQAFGGATPPDCYPSWSGSENGLNNLGYLSDFPLNTWVRIEYEIYLNDVDAANGYFNLTVEGYDQKLSGNITQRKTGFTKANYLLDTTLLGLEIANPKRWFTPSTLTASTAYTATVNGTPYTYTSTGVPTKYEIVEALRVAISAGGHVCAIYNNEELYVDYAKTTTYSANFVQVQAFGLQVAEVYLDTSQARFMVGDANTYAACTVREPQPYKSWSDTKAILKKNYGNIVGRKWLYFVDNSLTKTLIKEVF